MSEEKFKNKDIKISAISISGWPNLYVNPELVPEFSPMSIWKETGGASKSIIIPWAERSNGLHKISVSQDHQKLFIMIHGSMKSTYYLKVQTLDSNNPIEKLSTGSKEQFFTPYGKIKNFMAAVRFVAHSTDKPEKLVKNQKVKVLLHSINKHVEL